MRLAGRLALAGLLSSACACGDGAGSLVVRLRTSSAPRLDPFAPELGLERVRVFVEGEGQNDDAIVDLDPRGSAREVALEGLSSERARVRVEGYGASGAVLAFGRARSVELAGRPTVDVAFRRNLAYVIHRPNPAQRSPARFIYALDLARRAFVEKIEIPGTDPVARAITARGGAHMIVTWREGVRGFAGLLSLDDHVFEQVIELPGVQDVALGVPGRSRGIAIGGGWVTHLDFAAGTAEVVDDRVGGGILDAAMSADGRRVLAAIDVSPPGLLFFDLDERSVEVQSILPDPAGVALDARGEIAYVTSRTQSRVVAFDLGNRRAEVFDTGFSAPVELTVFSDSLLSVLGIYREGSAGRMLSYHVPSQTGLPLDASVETLSRPTGVAIDGTGRRAVVVAAGTSTAGAGLTLVDAFVDRLEGSGRWLYPGDPDDTFTRPPNGLGEAPRVGRQRYQPASVAVVYGR
jgi:hypothetical protein